MNKLRTKRESLGLTLKDVSSKIGVHFTTISDWELGRKIPRPKNKIKIANLYQCDADSLFGEVDNSLFSNITTHESGGCNYYKSPFAKFIGELAFHDGGSPVDCYVLDTEERVISFRGTLKAIAGREGGNLAEYIGVSGLKPYINSELVLAETIDFVIPGTQYKGKGITAGAFLDICSAYVQALRDRNLTTERQRGIAITCSVLLSACAKTGLVALIDEATGYQYERQADALQLKLKAFVADEMRGWEKTFPDELWEQFGRLTKWKGSLHSRPKWWGKLVMELIYNALDADVAEYLKDNKPPPVHKQNYHQWLSGHYGLKKLITHIYEIIGMAKTCDTIKELQEKAAYHYRGKPFPLRLF